MTSAYDFSFRDLDGQPQALARYQGHPLLLVNVASRCGFTPPSAQPPTAMAQSLACQWFNLGPAYWTALPSTEALQPRFVTSG